MTIETMTWVAITPKHAETAVRALQQTERSHRYDAMELLESYKDEHGKSPEEGSTRMLLIKEEYALARECKDAYEAILSSSMDASNTVTNS